MATKGLAEKPIFVVKMPAKAPPPLTARALSAELRIITLVQKLAVPKTSRLFCMVTICLTVRSFLRVVVPWTVRPPLSCVACCTVTSPNFDAPVNDAPPVTASAVDAALAIWTTPAAEIVTGVVAPKEEVPSTASAGVEGGVLVSVMVTGAARFDALFTVRAPPTLKSPVVPVPPLPVSPGSRNACLLV